MTVIELLLLVDTESLAEADGEPLSVVELESDVDKLIETELVSVGDGDVEEVIVWEVVGVIVNEAEGDGVTVSLGLRDGLVE